MSVFGDKLESAINESAINNYVWKGAKEYVNGEAIQNEIKLIDATEEQLNTFYDHCLSMLYIFSIKIFHF